MDILITPRLTLRPPIDWDMDDIADITGDAARAARILASACFIIMRERAIGWVDAHGRVTLHGARAGHGYEAEALAAVSGRDLTASSRNRGDRHRALLKSAAIQAAAPA
jgi:hypothetical protein